MMVPLRQVAVLAICQVLRLPPNSNHCVNCASHRVDQRPCSHRFAGPTMWVSGAGKFVVEIVGSSRQVSSIRQIAQHIGWASHFAPFILLVPLCGLAVLAREVGIPTKFPTLCELRTTRLLSRISLLGFRQLCTDRQLLTRHVCLMGSGC